MNTSGEYVVQGQLVASNGNTLNQQARFTLSSGTSNVTLFYDVDDILESLAVDGPYQLPYLNVLSLSDEGIVLAGKGTQLGETDAISLADLCSEDIVIGEAVISPIIQNNMIGALEFSVPVSVTLQGSYQMSFKVVSATGQDIDLVAFSRFLSQGQNDITFTVGSDQFQTSDGPYQLISALVVRGGISAQKAFVGSSDTLLRWQFVPTKQGDLDADGDVDAADRAILVPFRNQQALTPGDRRDLDNDGKITIRDILLLQRLN